MAQIMSVFQKYISIFTASTFEMATSQFQMQDFRYNTIRPIVKNR